MLYLFASGLGVGEILYSTPAAAVLGDFPSSGLDSDWLTQLALSNEITLLPSTS